MTKVLDYPFDGDYLLKKKRSIRRELLADEGRKFTDKKIAILCGSTADDVKDLLQLFLLDNGIRPAFYMSEYNKYWEDVMFDNPELVEFDPDVIYIHTTTRNILKFPTVKDSPEDIETLLEETFGRFAVMWDKIASSLKCPVIQNNFEQPFYRLLGNSDVSNIHGKLNFVNRLNEKLYEYARTHDNFYINDVNYMASCYGLQKWADSFYWHMYKYAMAVPAIPEFAYNLANIIKSIYGKNKKAFVLDLDNTLWGGIIGDDGPENIEIGQETPKAQLYSEFQSYIKEHKDLGIVLNVDSKNDEDKAVEGFQRPDSVLKLDDFLIFKANWNPKDRNLIEIADEINIGEDSLVFVDDNPAERHIVKSQVPSAAVPDIGEPQSYIPILDRCGFFEVTNFSADDLKRNEMYKANVERKRQQASFTDYKDYLVSLEMTAEIGSFPEMYMARISQLSNKSNQFNLTTKRCSLADIQNFTADPAYVTLYGKLIDKFGDNGVVAVTFGHAEGETLHIDLWLMSCRVLKRDMEKAMLDKLVERCKDKGVKEIRGYYYPTPKNNMVREFYAEMGFDKVSEDEEGNSEWVMQIEGYEPMNEVIKVVDTDKE